MVSKHLVGVAGEFAVASELCRRGVNAQVTFGNRKKIDILADKGNKYLRIQVKSKQKRSWPGCRGVSGDDILVLVDYQKKDDVKRPDFYILTAEDWLQLLHENYQDKIDSGELVIGEDNCPLWVKNNYYGHSLPAKEVTEHLEKWDKIISRLETEE
ncbi:MAG: hypothetical protein ACTSPI_13430 [Candidatus Heimdallarchaeaceae archaeon]